MEFQLKHKHAKEVKEIIDMKKIFYPFWIGYFNRKDIFDFKAVDAVSGQAQGIKMRKIFLQAFRQMG
jgi:hypothetical protein